jgi:pyridoxal phosphate enzyme (YggS family)
MTGPGGGADLYRAARDRVLGRIEAACGRVGRDPTSVTLLAVSKTVSAEQLRAAAQAGITELGENRVQEALTKAPDVPGVHWHLVGPLQTNKARKAIEVFASIQTVDSVALAERLDRLAGELRPDRPYPVLIQVNVDDDPAKAGFQPDALASAAARLDELAMLDIQGVMTIGRLVEDPDAARPTFRRLSEIATHLRDAGHRIGPELSMGMTEDFEVAIEEGATIVRIGRAIFGERPDHEHGPATHSYAPG